MQNRLYTSSISIDFGYMFDVHWLSLIQSFSHSIADNRFSPIVLPLLAAAIATLAAFISLPI